LPLISSVEGRTRDVLRTRGGRVVSGIFFPHMLKEISEVSQFQVEQPRIDEIVLSIVLTCPLSDRSQTLIRDEVAKVFGEDTRVLIKFVEKIPHRPSGKRRATVGLGDSSTIDGTDVGTLGR
jgi:phenylacetate-CoA ligase